MGNRTYASYVDGKYGEWNFYYESGKNRLDYIELPPQGKIDYTFNANGCQADVVQTIGNKKVREMKFEYDYENRLTKIKIPLKPGVVGPANVYEYVYDANGMRVKKLINSHLTTVYHYDEMGNVLQETDEDGNLLATYIYANGQRIARVKGDEIIYYHNDVLGSPALLMNDRGEVVHLYHFGPFGNIEAAKGTSGNKYRFTGKEQDETGLYYFGARYYDPLIGRFITPDPVEGWGPKRLNPYVYCYNNPLIYVDPKGELPIVLTLIIAGAVIGGTVGGIYAGVTGKNVVQYMLAGMVMGATIGTGIGVGGAIAWGAAIGSVVGGVTGEILGKNVLEYTLLGAAAGAIVGTAFTFSAGGMTGFESATLGAMVGGPSRGYAKWKEGKTFGEILWKGVVWGAAIGAAEGWIGWKIGTAKGRIWDFVRASIRASTVLALQQPWTKPISGGIEIHHAFTGLMLWGIGSTIGGALGLCFKWLDLLQKQMTFMNMLLHLQFMDVRRLL
jgi:RHS repeat-associated protein